MRTRMALLALSVLVGVTGCGKEEAGQSARNDQPAPKIDTTPVTLKFAVHFPLNDEFQELYIEPVKKKYPHITLEIERVSSFAQYDKLIAAGQLPDLYISFNGNMPGLKERGFNEDMSELFKRHKVDLNRFQQNFLDDIKYAATEKGELYGLPIETAFHALYYNKDIFDKFGVPYPKDGMTMEDAMEVTKRMTRLMDGVQYRGWDYGSMLRMSQPLGLELLDKKTGKAIMSSNESWKRVFELVKQIYMIPGNAPSSKASERALAGFITGRTIAMLSETSKFSNLIEAEKEGLKWDVVQHPFYKEKPNTYGNATVYMAGVTPASKYKEQALQVIEVFTSDEVQMNISKYGRISPLKNEAVQKAFGQGYPPLRDKNVAGILKSSPVKYPVYLYREETEKIANAKFDAYLKGSADVNTILKQADEEINKVVEQLKK